MNWEELIIHLQNNHFYPKKVVVIKLKSEKITGLEVYSPPILMLDRLEIISKLIGDEYKCEKVQNQDCISIIKV